MTAPLKLTINMKKTILKAILYYFAAKLGAAITWMFATIVCLFYYTEDRTDVVKRLDRKVVTLKREYISKRLKWFTTHDNAADEWWYGVYNTKFPIKAVREWTQEDYDNSWFIRYFCRVAWMYRNPSYGFSHYVLGFERGENYYEEVLRYGKEDGFYCLDLRITKTLEGSQAFNIEGRINIPGPKYWNVNFGWKAHKGFSRLMFAGRLFKLKDK